MTLLDLAALLAAGSLIGFGWAAGARGAALDTALLVLALVVALLGWMPALLALSLWVIVKSAAAMAMGRGWSRGSRVLGAALGLVQLPVLLVLGVGLVAGARGMVPPDVAEARRGAAVYPAIAAAGAAVEPRLEALAGRDALAYPPPVEPQPAVAASPAPPRPIAWAEAVPWAGAAERVLTGTVRAAERAPLGFEVEGRVATVEVRIGERFERGDALATLDTTTLEIALEERRSALIEAEARLTEARREAERRRALFGRGVAAEAALETAEAGFGTARSRAEVARAAIRAAEERLRDATLRAPYDGSVAARLAEPAQLLAAGEPAFEIQSEGGGFEIDATVPETLVGRLELGSRHRARVLDGSRGGEGSVVTAELREIGSRASAATGFPVTLAVLDEAVVLAAAGGAGSEPRPGPRLRAGTSVELHLMLAGRDAEPSGVVAVPIEALAATEDGHAVLVFDPEESVLRRRAVALAGTEGRHALVAEGLAPGEVVAIRGLPFLRDGQSVALQGVGIARYDL